MSLLMYLLCNILAALQVVVTIRQNFWLNNRHNPILKKQTDNITLIKVTLH